LIPLETADHNDVLFAEPETFRRGVGDFLEAIDPPVAEPEARLQNLMLDELIRKLTYFPDQALDLSPARLRLPPDQVQAILVGTGDGLTLHGWHLVADGHLATDRAAADRHLSGGRPLALFFSGNGGNRSYRLPETGILTRAGADVFLFDYRGYGDNPGHPSEAGLTADAMSIWKYATFERRVAPARIFLYGESLGGAVAVQLAASLCGAGTSPAGIILRSTFSSLADVARHHYPIVPIGLLLSERYDSVEKIRKVTCPILMLHGQRDTIVPYELARKLFAAAPERSADGSPKQFVDLPHSDHNDVLDADSDLVASAVGGFINRTAEQ
jgi:fermentation-respiration switch protein FrsA (DUF1100 family)